MILFRRSSIRTKLKLAILSTTVLSVALVFAGLFIYEQYTYNDILARDLSTKTDIIAKNSDAALAFGNSADATQVLQSLSTQTHIVAAAMYDRNGMLFASYLREGEYGSIPSVPTRDGLRFENDALIFTRPIKLNKDQIGTIYVKTDLVGKEEHFRSYSEIALLLLLGSLAVAFLVATILERNISKPILNLADTTQQVSKQKDYSIRAVKLSDDETGFLTDAVNRMLEQIQERDISLRHTNDAMAEEIAIRKRVEQALRAAEIQLRVITDTTPMLLTRCNRERQYIYVNQAVAKLLNVTPEQIIGKSVREIMGEEGYESLSPHIDAVLQGKLVEFETRIAFQSGPRFFRAVYTPDKNEHGDVVGWFGSISDVTESKLADQALRDSEERTRVTQSKLAAIVESSQDAIISKDLNGIITSWNSGAKRIFGYDAEEIIGQPMTRLIPNDRLSEEDEITHQLWKNNTVNHFDTIRVSKDGTPVYVSLTVSPMRDRSGKVIGASKIARDITEKKLAERALRQAHDELEMRVKERTVDLIRANEELQKRDLQLSTAQQIARLGSWEWNLQTSEVTWSDELYRIYGLQKGEFGGTAESFLDKLHAEDRSATIGYIEEAIRTHEPFDFEERIIRRDGNIRILHSRGKVVKDESDKVVKLLGVCLDVTDRKRAEEKFRGLLESAPDAMVIARQDGSIVLVNAQTERLFGYHRSELLGQQVDMLLPQRFRLTQNYFITQPALQADEDLELYGLRKNNTEFPVEVSLSPLPTEEGLLVASAIRDITEQQRLRARLLAAERQRSADLRRYTLSVQRAQEEERQRIARELHDDLCQKLSGLKLKVEVIADEVSAENSTLHHTLQTFNKQCDEMIVGVRRLSSNLRPVVLDDFGLVVALGFLTREFEDLHKIRIKLEMDKSVRMHLDPQLEIALYRIGQEALSNIAKHAQASRVTVALQKNDEVIVLRISDNGKGFSPKVASRKDSLHGLGLISMRERTGLLGGTFAIESNEKGTIITATIPLTMDVKYERVGVSSFGSKEFSRM